MTLDLRKHPLQDFNANRGNFLNIRTINKAKRGIRLKEMRQFLLMNKELVVTIK